MNGACPRERFIVPEMLDHAPPDVARASLRDLERINRYLGGYLRPAANCSAAW